MVTIKVNLEQFECLMCTMKIAYKWYTHISRVRKPGFRVAPKADAATISMTSTSNRAQWFGEVQAWMLLGRRSNVTVAVSAVSAYE